MNDLEWRHVRFCAISLKVVCECNAVAEYLVYDYNAIKL